MGNFDPVDTRRRDASCDPTFVTVHASSRGGFALRLRSGEMHGAVLMQLGHVPTLGHVAGVLAVMRPEKTWRRVVPDGIGCDVLKSLRSDDPSFYEVWA